MSVEVWLPPMPQPRPWLTTAASRASLPRGRNDQPGSCRGRGQQDVSNGTSFHCVAESPSVLVVHRPSPQSPRRAEGEAQKHRQKGIECRSVSASARPMRPRRFPPGRRGSEHPRERTERYCPLHGTSRSPCPGHGAVVSAGWIDAAVTAGGATVLWRPSGATGVVWTQADDPDGLAASSQANPQIDWVQLPWAGIEPFLPLLDIAPARGRARKASTPTGGRAVSRSLFLAGLRRGAWPTLRADTAGLRPAGRNLLGAQVTIFGGGGIAEALSELFAPFSVAVTVVRRNPAPIEWSRAGARYRRPARGPARRGCGGAGSSVATDHRRPHRVGLGFSTPWSTHAWLVNVARSAHVVTEAIWSTRCVMEDDRGCRPRCHRPRTAAQTATPCGPCPTPSSPPGHTGNTPAMARLLLAARITDNVRRYAAGIPFVGLVDVDAGY